MKILIVVLACFVFVACGSATTPTLAQGTIHFQMDNLTCTYTGSKNVTFYIATEEAGTESMATGVASAGYRTNASASYPKPGNPIVQARIANYTKSGGALWTNIAHVKVMPNESVTQTFGC